MKDKNFLHENRLTRYSLRKFQLSSTSGGFRVSDSLSQQKKAVLSLIVCCKRRTKQALMNKTRMLLKDIQNRFGSAVRAWRNGLGISQEELAGRAGLHRTYIADVERGARNLCLANMEKLAVALGAPLPTLFSHVHLPAGQTAPGQMVDILLVEDELADIELTLRAFKKVGLTNRIHIARDGAEALDYLFGTGAYAKRKLEIPQMILLDLKLPKVPGLEVLRRVKADERTRNVPVVVLTASENARDVRESKRLGAESYIVKPVDFPRFIQAAPQRGFAWALLKLTVPVVAEVTENRGTASIAGPPMGEQ